MCPNKGGTFALAMRATSRATWWMKGMWRPRFFCPRSGKSKLALQPKQCSDARFLPAATKSERCACLGVMRTCGTVGACPAVPLP